VAGRRERDGKPAAAHGELKDRAAGAVGQGEVQVEIARVVDEVEVVQPREGGRRFPVGRTEAGRVDRQASQRTV
jgi:hypothetical protein